MDSHDLQTHLHTSIDFTESNKNISVITSSGKRAKDFCSAVEYEKQARILVLVRCMNNARHRLYEAAMSLVETCMIKYENTNLSVWPLRYISLL